MTLTRSLHCYCYSYCRYCCCYCCSKRAVDLAKLLQAKSIVSYNNVEMEVTGVLTKIVTQTGDIGEFKQLAKEAGIEYIQASHFLHNGFLQRFLQRLQFIEQWWYLCA
jgi:phosphosulfolactate synthase (CoM biosynthesis protein A)